MLKQRLTTGLALAAVTVCALLWLPHSAVSLLLLAVILAAGWEWAVLAGLKTPLARALYVSVLALTLGLFWYASISEQNLAFVLGISGLWWGSVLVILSLSEPKPVLAMDGRYLLRTTLLAAGLLTLVPCWLAAKLLHDIQPGLLLFSLLLIWVADSMAFFTGKRFGKTKLAPLLSPGKTREGLFGALVGALAIAALAAIWFRLPPSHVFYFIGLCLVATLFSVVGDLFESLIKRLAGVKDSSNILPGHGGILDRIDSFTAAAPVFTLGLYWISWPEKMPV
jgi:phosphatidate cytidylyltransferase